MALAVLHTGYDAILAKYAGNIPVAYMRALAYRESKLDPDIVSNAGAVGLFQVKADALADFNKANHTAFTIPELKNPERNAQVGGWFLNHIVKEWSKVSNLKADWTSERFPALLTLGYNAGWSLSHGVGRVAIELSKISPSIPLTVDMVREAAVVIKDVSSKVTEEGRVKYAKLVAATYLRGKPVTAKIPAPQTGDKLALWGLGLSLLGLAIVIIPKRRKGKG